jgi:hypothetical protein
MWKSILAVVSGIVVLTVTSFAIEWTLDPLLRWAFPVALPDSAAMTANSWVWALTFAYSLICVALGGYVCARLAPRLPQKHAWAMGFAQAGMTLLAMLSFPALASVSQWIVTALLAIPAAAGGGWLYMRRPKSAA